MMNCVVICIVCFEIYRTPLLGNIYSEYNLGILSVTFGNTFSLLGEIQDKLLHCQVAILRQLLVSITLSGNNAVHFCYSIVNSRSSSSNYLFTIMVYIVSQSWY